MALTATIPRRFPEYAICIYGFLLLSRAVIPLIEGSQGDEGMSSHSQLYTVLLAIFYVIIAVLLYKHRKLGSIWTIFWRNRLLALLLVLLAASILWSVEPMFTLRRAIALGGTTLFGLYLVLCFHPRQVVVLLVSAVLIAAALSLGFTLFEPEIGIHHIRGGGLRGVYKHRVDFGNVMAMGFAAAVALVLLDGRLRPFHAFSLGVLGIMIWASQSATAIITGATLFVMLTVLTLVRRKPMSRELLLVLGIGLTVVGSTIVVMYAEMIVSAVGRDLTLTGRTALWADLLPLAHERPLLGYGYGAFWYNEAARMPIHQLQGWIPNHAHNGPLETVLDVGYVGLGLFAGLVIVTVHRVLRRTLHDRRQVWPLAILMMLLMVDQTISIIVDHAVFWAIFVHLNVTATFSPQAMPQPAPRQSRDQLSSALASRTTLGHVNG